MMTKISQLGNDVFEVVVVGDTTTCHEVIVTDKVLLELTNNLVSKKDLLDFSFNFLLRKEPNTSIMTSFEISIIGQFFTEYKNEVRSWCHVI